jgi:hypothetical protein
MEKAYFVESSYGVKFVCHAKNREDALKSARDMCGACDLIMVCEEITKDEMEQLHFMH